MPQEITKSSTAPACIFIIPQFIPKDKDPTLTIPVVNRTKTVVALIGYQNQGYILPPCSSVNYQAKIVFEVLKQGWLLKQTLSII